MQNTDTDTATQLLALPLEIKAEGAPGTFEGYGAIFGNKDRDGDIVARGAFSASLAAGKPALLWQHDQKAPIGRFDEVREDEKGLYVKGRLAMHGRGEEAYELLKMGALDGLSIGFVTKESSRDPVSGTRTITLADLMEISLVTFPANELARVSNVKSVSSVKAACFDKKDTNMLETEVKDARSFERMLRENGFSRSRAKTITAKGFKVTDYAADKSAEITLMVEELKERQVALEEKARFRLQIHAGLSWGKWKKIASVTYSRAGSFKISASSTNPGRIKGPFKLKIKYKSINGLKEDLWLSNGGAAGNGPYKVPEGIQEIWVRAKAMAIPQNILVTLS